MHSLGKRALYSLLVAALVCTLLVPAPAIAQSGPAIALEPIGAYATGIFDEGASEIIAYDPATQRIFSVNAAAATVDILNIGDATSPTLVGQIDVTPYGAVANSVAVKDGLIAVAVEAEEATDPGRVVILDIDGNVLTHVEVGSLPDMVTFTPDGTKILTANEGEPSADYTVDPPGTISIIDLGGGAEAVTQDDVITLDFAAFEGTELDPSIRIFGPEATLAQDLEPEYIAVTADSSTAYVTLQENNALGIVDLASGAITGLVGLGTKDWGRPQAKLQTYTFADLPVLGTTAAGQDILLGGFSGLYFEGIDETTGNLRFLTHPDRGPNPEPVDLDGDGIDERPFALPDYQAQWVRFEFDPASGAISVTEQILLTRADGAPISGRPNLPGESGLAYADEIPVDLIGNPLEFDPYGADMEGIVRADDGAYWMVDEYRPAIYHFAADGVLIERFVPEGSNESGVDTGTEAIPAVFAQRRANRGFEAVAYDNGILYAFMQSPLDNPDLPSDRSSRASVWARILAFDIASGTTVGQYLYPLDGGAVDKIGDAVALGDGAFLVIERDAALGPDAQKFIYRLDLAGATNLEELPIELTGPEGRLERQNVAGLAAAGILPASKDLVVDLAEIGYVQGDKPEGLAIIDEATLAVLIDNDFGVGAGFDPVTGLLNDNPAAITPVLGIISLLPQGLDPSDEDGGANFAQWPVETFYMPDAIAAYEVDGETYLVTANEGDARDYDGYSEEARVEDLVLDWADFPNAPELQSAENLGRLRTTTANGDTDGDGLIDVIYGFGGRSFSIWSADGQLVYDSGDDFEAITAEVIPEAFNSNGDAASFDSRSDDKGPEPEAVTVGVVGDRTYAFIGLERTGGILVYDITNPTAPVYLTYANNRDTSLAADAVGAGDTGPESVVFIAAEDSPTGEPLLAVGNEVSGSITLYAITVSPN